MMPLSIWVLIVWLLWPEHRSFELGLAVGALITFPFVLSFAAPEHVDRWRRGADGEKWTAKELRKLRRDGWTILHDLPDGDRRNRDHVAIAPSGRVFLLDTKAPGGIITVKHGVLKVRWLEDPDDGYERDLTPRMRAAAAQLANELSPFLPHRPWITPVVVIWGRWDGQPHIHRDVAWVHGKDLANRLAANSGEAHASLHSLVARGLEALQRAGLPRKNADE